MFIYSKNYEVNFSTMFIWFTFSGFFEENKFSIQTQLCLNSLIFHNVSAHTDCKLNNVGAVFSAL